MKKRTEDAYPLSLRIPMSLYEEMIKAVEDSGMTKTEFILRAIREKLKAYKFESDQPDAVPVTRAEIRDMIREELGKDTSFTVISSKKQQMQRL